MKNAQEREFRRGPFRGWTRRELWAAWDWRWIGHALTIVLIIGATGWCYRDRDGAVLGACKARYAAAHSARDSAAVDLVVIGGRARSPLDCGTLRREGSLGAR
jgi:hypothetical protein